MNLNKIKMILFDYGGVLAPEGFQLGILKLAQNFNKSFKEMYDIGGYKAGLDSGYTAGKASEEVYWNRVAELIGIDDDLYWCRSYFLDNFQPRADMISLVQKLSLKYKLGIFSDQTNWIYELDDKYDFMKYFQYRCISYDKGYTKHQDEFYRIPATETGYNPEEILLVDDKPRVAGIARRLGMNAFVFTTVKKCRNFFGFNGN